jgi:hypothetical protein
MLQSNKANNIAGGAFIITQEKVLWNWETTRNSCFSGRIIYKKILRQIKVVQCYW